VLGVNWTTSSPSHVKLPRAPGVEKWIERSAAARSATDRTKVTVTGIPTPTTSPGAGAMFETVAGPGVAASPVLTDPFTRSVAVPAIAST
jgi:hypothetical protein